MTITVRRGRYLIERTRRQLVGVIAQVGTGGSIPGPAQAALEAYVESVAAGQRGADRKKIFRTEMSVIRDAMKRLQGTWLVLHGGLRWVHVSKNPEAELQKALKSAGWSLGAEHLRSLLS